jgi:hypothetical protein
MKRVNPLAWPLLMTVLLASACAQPNNIPVNESPNAERTGGSKGQSESDKADAPTAAGGASGEGDSGPEPTVVSDCQPGAHKCGTACVSNNDPANCGKACVPCPAPSGGTATCDGTKCGVECPAGKKPCLDACIDLAAACDGTCPDGKNACNGICVDAASVAACGSACVTCPTSPNGKTTCDGDKCLLACDAGFHACGGGCAKDTDIATCGAGCTPCPVPTGGTATCDGTKCGAECPGGMTLCKGACIPQGKACDGACPAGTHNCSNNCVSDKDVANCGPTSCMPCKVPAGGSATCNGSTCDITCRSGYHRCGDECKDNKSVTSCGTKCDAPCPTASGASATCDGTSCGLKCNGGLYMCNGVCQQCCNDNQCGSGKACANGTCVTACKAGVACTNGIGACRAGKTFCASATSQAECRDSGADDSRNTCGSGNICSGGACVATCRQGTCPNKPCHRLTSVCKSQVGQPTCDDQEDPSNTAGCASGVCNGGSCAPPCTKGSCPAARACHKQVSVCGPGELQPHCEEQPDPGNSSGCESNRCNGATCAAACSAGSLQCTPSDECHTSTSTCDQGASAPHCVVKMVANNVPCGSGGKSCQSGSCKCGPNSVEIGGQCQQCGAANQPCCAGDKCTGQSTTCWVDLAHDIGDPKSCLTCGGLNQPCCISFGCNPPAACSKIGAGPGYCLAQ